MALPTRKDRTDGFPPLSSFSSTFHGWIGKERNREKERERKKKRENEREREGKRVKEGNRERDR